MQPGQFSIIPSMLSFPISGYYQPVTNLQLEFQILVKFLSKPNQSIVWPSVTIYISALSYIKYIHLLL